jgi:hypothetical protein
MHRAFIKQALGQEQGVAEDSKKRCMKCGMIDCPCPGVDCKCEPIKGWIPNKGFRKAMEEAAVKEKWTQKYKSSINCSHPKGFSQKAHCAGKKKQDESVAMEMVCESCGMCETHGNVTEFKKGQKDSNGVTKCWPGKHAEGTKKGRNGGQVRNCVPNEGVAEAANVGLSWMEMSPEQQQAFSAKQKADRAFAANPVPAGLSWMEMSPEQQQIFSAKQRADRAAAALGLNEAAKRKQ